jgi:8-hydroxy-5-deazaflavin:NADPH oxidoreductase
MQLAIIGAGNVGNALATGWTAAGHQITFGVRDPQAAPAGAAPAATYASVAAAARSAEVIVLSVPWQAVPDALASAGNLSGKIVIDCTNPLQMGPDGLELALAHTGSGAERVAELAPGALVFKTLNQTGFANMEHAHDFALPAVMYVAGDDETRKPLVMSLVADLGFQAVDAGPLRIARLLEPMAMLWIHMALNRGEPMTTAFALSRRS